MPGQSSVRAIQFLLLGFLFIFPFILPWHFNPDPGYFNKMSALLITLVMLTIAMFWQQWTMPIPKMSFGLLILAIYWLLLSRVMALPYLEYSDSVTFIFVLLALLSWWVQSRIQLGERDGLLYGIAWIIIIGVFLQTLVVIAQITSWAESTRWVVHTGDVITGQLAQRNHLGHYLMWGIVAVAYLLSAQKIKPWLGWGLLIYFCVIIGANNSRTIIAYVLGVATVLLYARIVGGRQVVKNIKYFAAALIALLFFQFATPIVLEYFGWEGASSLERLAQDSPVFRYQEWGKAWELFKERPLFGYGYGSYIYQSFLKDWDMVPNDSPRLAGLFSHCHNLVLQLLAEMGIIGTLLVFGVMLLAALPMLKHPEKPHNIVLMSLITVSLCHSLLEFPLWYANFLIPFVIFFSLGQEKQNNTKINWNLPIKMRVVFAIPLIAGIVLTAMMMSKYKQLAYNFGSTAGESQSEAFGLVGKVNMPFMALKTDQIILMKAKLGSYDIPPEMVAVIERMNSVRPDGYAGTLHGLNLYREGKIKESQSWLRRVIRYHPNTTTKTLDYVYDLTPKYKKLEHTVYEMCLYNKKYWPEKVTKCKKPPNISVFNPAVDE